MKENTAIEKWINPGGPPCLVIRAQFQPIGGIDRFQPAGFPEIGHVLYPRPDNSREHVCIVDSPASMANHLETVCLSSPTDPAGLHPDLKGLPFVACYTGDEAPGNSLVATTLGEGHRLASDYFLDGFLGDRKLREVLREEFQIRKIEEKKFFIYPENWWSIYRTIFRYDPNSLIHGVLFAREQIKISRLLTAHLEAIGAARVSRSGVKFDRLGKTTSGQPIFSVDEETAREIRATFIIDLALLRSYGRGEAGLKLTEKRMLLELALWKVGKLLESPFRFRTGCHLECIQTSLQANRECADELPPLAIAESIGLCELREAVRVYYPASELFKTGEQSAAQEANVPAEEPES